MRSQPALVLAFISIAVCVSCSSTDKEHAHERAENAKREAIKLGSEAKAEVKTLDGKITRSLQGGQSGSAGASTAQAEQKLDEAGRELKAAGPRAAVKLDQAATVAKVKAKLAQDVGLFNVANVSIDSTGTTVTLTGSVSSEDRKRHMGQSAEAVDGVTKVINHLTVQP